jgi:hypothetical protein
MKYFSVLIFNFLVVAGLSAITSAIAGNCEAPKLEEFVTKNRGEILVQPEAFFRPEGHAPIEQNEKMTDTDYAYYQELHYRLDQEVSDKVCAISEKKLFPYKKVTGFNAEARPDTYACVGLGYDPTRLERGVDEPYQWANFCLGRGSNGKPIKIHKMQGDGRCENFETTLESADAIEFLPLDQGEAPKSLGLLFNVDNYRSKLKLDFLKKKFPNASAEQLVSLAVKDMAKEQGLSDGGDEIRDGLDQMVDRTISHAENLFAQYHELMRTEFVKNAIEWMNETYQDEYTKKHFPLIGIDSIGFYFETPNEHDRGKTFVVDPDPKNFRALISGDKIRTVYRRDEYRRLHYKGEDYIVFSWSDVHTLRLPIGFNEGDKFTIFNFSDSSHYNGVCYPQGKKPDFL